MKSTTQQNIKIVFVVFHHHPHKFIFFTIDRQLIAKCIQKHKKIWLVLLK